MTPYDPVHCRQRAKRLLDEVITPLVFTELVTLEIAVHQCADPISHAQAVQAAYRPVNIGFVWGPLWSTAWFRLRGQVPASFTGEFRLLFDTRTEALCWWDGVPYQAVELHRQDVKLPDSVRPGSPLEVYVEAACNHMIGVIDKWYDAPRMGELPVTRSGRLRWAHLARYDEPMAGLATELEALIDLSGSLPADSAAARRANVALAEVEQVIRLDHVQESAPAARERLNTALKGAGGSAITTAVCVGHAHIDLAWLWPIRETKRKAARTFSTALRNMERHPNFRFFQSQAQLYEWVRHSYPALFEQIQHRVRTGQWEVGGAAWVEPDCNVPSGESLVRQLLLGTLYFEHHFGIKQNYFWEPDVFGYSAALPQILKLMEIDFFFSWKLNWNQYNRFPYHSFRWLGIDGTAVLSHFLPVENYSGTNLPAELRKAEQGYQQSACCPTWLQTYGWGDGGGGPTEEQIRRVNLLGECSGVPQTRHGTVSDFAEILRTHEADLPEWHGELYFELHRGTYTTHAQVKRQNRLGERQLQDLEIAQSIATITGRPRTTDEAAETDRLWKLLLLNQFHDILPGSSITWVYEDTMRDYEEMHRGIATLLAALGGSRVTEDLTVLNTSGRARSEILAVAREDAAASRQLQQIAATQDTTNIDGRPQCIAYSPLMVPMAARTLSSVRRAPEISVPATVKGRTLENEHLVVALNEAGQVTSLLHKASGRDAIRPGEAANRLVIYDDLPHNHDAWDVDLGYADKATPVNEPASCEVVESGPVRAALEFRRSLGCGSTLVQRVQLGASARHVEFETRVSWHESSKLLRVLHSVDVHSDHATYEIQFGHLRRPNHFNTSWDWARFEVPAQRWMDLSDPAFGVTLLNNCKYGHSCLGNVLGLSLLRATTWPDPTADRGEHAFCYALMPHGRFDSADAIAVAESLNQPLKWLPGGLTASTASLAAVSPGAGVVLDSLKPAEDGDGLILRLYEIRGERTTFELQLHPSVAQVEEVNLLEHRVRDVHLDQSAATTSLALRPFQILSLRLRPR